MQHLLRAYTQQAARRAEDETEAAVRRYAPMVYRIVRQVASRLPPNVDREEMFSAGMVGLLDALEKFDAARKIDFEAYARIRVKGAILDELRNIDHLTRRMRYRTKSIRDAKTELGEEATHETLAQKTGLSVEQVQASETHVGAPTNFEPEMLDHAGEATLWEKPPTLLDTLEWEDRVRVLSSALGELPEKNRLVLGLYYEAELTLREIGDVLGVTQSRVSQILRQTVELLKEHIDEAAA